MHPIASKSFAFADKNDQRPGYVAAADEQALLLRMGHAGCAAMQRYAGRIHVPLRRRRSKSEQGNRLESDPLAPMRRLFRALASNAGERRRNLRALPRAPIYM